MKVLVVVDMQNDFITGSLGTPEAQAIVPNVKKKVEEAVTNDDIIIYTRDTHFNNYLHSTEGKKMPVEHCLLGTYGWRIPDELMPPADYDKSDVVEKYTFGMHQLPSVLHNSYLGWFLSGEITEIELVGLCTDICIISNALLMKSWFYDIVDISVDATCCAGVTPETHEAALKTMEMCQINVKR